VYLKSVVQSFISRGTLGGIKGAIAAATIVGPEDIEINEFFDDNEFSVNISLEGGVEFENAITGSVIEEVADLSAPSGVRLRLVKFAPQEAQEEIELRDAAVVRDALAPSDEMSVDDFATFDRRGLFETIASADAFAIDPNQTTTADTQLSADATFIDPNQTTTSDFQVSADALAIDPNVTSLDDSMFADDTIAVGGFTRRDIPEVTAIDDTAVARRFGTDDIVSSADASVVDDVSVFRQRWEDNDNPQDLRWSFFSWTELEDLIRGPADTQESVDAVQLDPNLTTTSDTQLSADSFAISPNVSSVTSVAFADDVAVVETQVTGGINKTIVDELLSADDTVFVGGINNPSPVDITAADDTVTVGGIDTVEPEDVVGVLDDEVLDERDVFDQIWEPNDTTETDLRWDFFSWTELEDLPDQTEINTMFVDDVVTVDADTTTTPETIDASVDIERVLPRDKDDYRWNTGVDTEEVSWDFFSWVARGVTGVDDEFLSASDEMNVSDTEAVNTNKPSVLDDINVDDAVDIPTTTTAEGINADDSQLLDEAVVIWGLDNWGSLQWAVEQ